MLRRGLLALAGLVAAGAAQALPIAVQSYDMPNGNTGSYEYWDQNYAGSTPAANNVIDGAALAGGKGDLTDGIIANQNWFVVEAPPGNGPYVGWTQDPTITFRFNGVQSFFSMTLWLDDADGAGGVNAPSSVDVKVGSNASENFVIAEPVGSDPFAFVVPLAGKSGDTVVVTLNRKNAWVFLSEVAFEDGRDVAIPEPASLALLGLALAGLGMRRHRRTRA